MGWGMLLLAVVFVAHQTLHLAATAQVSSTGSDSRTATYQPPVLAGTRQEIEGTEVVWQLPDASAGRPRGILLAFHGCSHGAIDWWPKGDGCPTCIGLPEEVLITRTALGRGYALVAVSSRDRQHRRCWAIPHQPGQHTVDTLAAVAVVKVLQQRDDLKGLPLYALGASSGGAFALTLPAFLPLTAVCSQIMALPSSMQQAFLDAPGDPSLGLQPAPQPPVLFVHMSRDTHTAERVAASVELRHNKNLKTEVIDVPPQPLTAQLLSRVPELSGELGQQLLRVFTAKGVIGLSGLIVKDPRHSDWHAVVQQSGVPGLQALNLTPDESGLSEVMNMAYAQHEFIADTTTRMLDWFEQQPVTVAGTSGQ